MPTDLDAIEKESGRDIEECFRKMLSIWLKSCSKQRCTWKAIINVLRTKVIHFESLANEIETEKGYSVTEDALHPDIKSHLVPETCPGSTKDIGKAYDCLTCFN